MRKEMSAIEAKNEAQKLVFAPIYFQVVVTLKELGILSLLSKHKKGLSISNISSLTNITEYGVKVLIEAAEAVQIVEYISSGIIALTKMGYMLNSDIMTNVNINFINDVCYNGAKYLTPSIQTGKPVGLKTLGDWKTLYEGLEVFPEKAKKSWFDYDHYYSDDAFPAALEIVFYDPPKYIFDIGGNTPYASQVKKKISVGCPDFEGITAFGI